MPFPDIDSRMTFLSEESNLISSLSAPAIEIEQNVHFFEGPEKTLEVEFQGAKESKAGLRTAGREAWDIVVKEAAASILDHLSNEYFDSYILSESSLFVMDDKVIIKTCGTTTLLHALPAVKNVGESLGLEPGFTTFMRKDLQCPGKQEQPHRSFNEEIEYFADFFHSKGDIVGQVLGPLTSDHWHLCTSPSLPVSVTSQPHANTYCTINIMMYGLSPEATVKFCKSDSLSSGVIMTDKSGIRSLMPSNTAIHEFAFDPCGYSMNALCGEYYATVHVTPESSCSYASFETTLPGWSDANVSSVLDVFLPSRFTITRASHNQCNCGHCAFPPVLMDKNGHVFHRIVIQQTSIASRQYTMANYRCYTLAASS